MALRVQSRNDTLGLNPVGEGAPAELVGVALPESGADLNEGRRRSENPPYGMLRLVNYFVVTALTSVR